jgi:GNAT superfamily N-acetyltransferase
VIRVARASDALDIAALAGHLGYPAEAADIPPRLAALEAAGRAVALVAEIDGRVVGLITSHILATLHHTEPVALLTTLVVSEGARGAGVGRELVRAAEDWARGEGAERMSVTSGLQRADAHQFYERLGYARTGVRFGKVL